MLASPEPAVRLRGATVRYGGKVALDDVSFSVETGRHLAIVGANGAGKSTLFRAMTGLQSLDAGEATVLGCPAERLGEAVRRRVAYVPETHPELAGARVLDVVAFRRQFYPSFDEPLFRDLTSPVGLGRSTRFGELSRGQRALVVVGLAIAQAPDVLLLDDPSLGLDPLARRRIVQAILAAARDRALTVIHATHEITDVERVADDILLLSRGRVACDAEEIEGFVARSAAVRVPPGAPREAIEELDSVLHVWPRRDHLEVILSGDEPALRSACTTLAILSGSSGELSPRPVSLEEVTLAWLARDSLTREAPHA